jgi:uncharacterized protein DUF5686/carboxypeptidase-like protein
LHSGIIPFYRLTITLTFCLVVICARAQHRPIRGNITNPFTKEKISFASVAWKRALNGTISDSAGNFTILSGSFTHDTLIVSYSGFNTVYIPVNTLKDTAVLTILLNEGKQSESVVVKAQYNRGLFWWKKIVKNRPRNDPYGSGAYSYELYNKLELDINNIHGDAFNQYKLLKPFGFILDNIDSISEKSPFLPVYMAETISDYYYTAKPFRTREVIKAVQTNGIRNGMVLHFMEGLHQKTDIYGNYLTLFGKEFISPLGSLGSSYYNYQGADTQYIAGQRYLHLLFSPKRQGENTFSGDCWIHYATWAIKKVNLEISDHAGINYVKRMNIIQEFTQKNDSAWVFGKDKFIVELSPLKKDKISLIARKTNMYRNSVSDDDKTANEKIANELSKNTKKEQILTDDSAAVKDGAYWQGNRHEPLSSNEQKVYKMIDTLKSIPLFRKYVNTAELIFDGHKKLGKLEIGPWFKWVSGNQREKLRLRFDLGTTEAFSRNLRLHGYLAYGFADNAFKGKIDGIYRIPGNQGYTLQASYIHDLDNGRVRYNDEDPTTDNMFSQLIRRPGIKQKFLQVDEIKTSVTKEWQNNFSAQALISRSAYETFNPLPPKQQIAKNHNDLTNTELGLRLRYAPGESKVETFRKDIRFKSSNPIFEARYAMGVPDLLGGKYQYQKASVMITQQFRIPRWGNVSYRTYAGKIFGEPLPFMLLELHPGNEVYYYNKESFNLMNRFEYFSDRYAGFSIEHNFEKKLLNLLPFMRKTNVRQFWNIKTVWGDLSPANRALNQTDLGNYHLRSLHGQPYTEIGTGLDNIFKYFRVDLVWRFSPEPNTNPGFGVFGSMHIQF